MRHTPVVLVVEDEFLVRDMIATCLREAGNQVIEASHAAEAVAVFDSGERIDVVFSDVRMPGAMDGAMLARWIKETHEDVPVILTSGNAGGQTINVEHFVAKPYRPGDVATLVLQLAKCDCGREH